MPDVTVVVDQPDVVIPLSAMLETPNEPEDLNDEATNALDPEVDADAKVADAAGKVEDKIEEATVAGASKEELNELRGLLRELRNDNISLKARLSAAERVQNSDFNDDKKADAITDLEKYQSALQAAKERDFSTLIAVMEVNPKYEDMAVVCSNNNFEDIFEQVATFRSENNKTDFSLELVKVKAEVWALPNPYKYMYEVIKEYHPTYAEKKTDETKDPEKKEPEQKLSAKEVLAKTKKVVTAPGSVANLGGSGDETKGGWTAERIDNMPESKLHEVPKEVYKKWLSGELD